MEAYRVLLGSSLSSSSAAFLTISLQLKHTYLEATKSEAISANLNWRYWKSANFFPNCFLEWRYFLAASRQNVAPPKLQLPMLILPPSRAFIAILKPTPSGPILFFAGILTLSKVTRAVGWIVQPIFSYFFPNSIPFVSPWTMNVEISVGEVLAMTM